MGFWETAGAAFLGALGVALVIGFGRFAKLIIRAKYTGLGQYETEIGRRINESAGELAKKLRDDRDD